MERPDDPYCTLYVNHGENHKNKYESIRNLKQEIEILTESKAIENWTIKTKHLDIIINFNETYSRSETALGHFTEYPFYLEVDFGDEVGWDETFAVFCDLIRHLRTRGANAVPACDFEEEIEAKIGKDSMPWM